MPGIGFNFSQYIQDNVEEALSGVKGANSVKIVGPNLEILEKFATQVMAEMAKVRGSCRLGIFHLLGQPNLNIRSIARGRALRTQYRRRQHRRSGCTRRHHRTTVLEGDRQFNLAVRLDPKYRSSRRGRSYREGRLSDTVRNQRLCAAQRDRGYQYRHRRIVHLSQRSQRFIPIKFSVRGRDLGSTVAEAQERSPRLSSSERLPDPVGRRIRRPSERQTAADDRRSDHAAADPGLAVRVVQLLRDSLLAVAGIPFAIGGGLIALYLAGLDFSVSAAIGFISLSASR